MLTIWEEIDPVTNNGAVFSNSLPFLGGWSGPVQVSQVGQHSTNPQAVIDSSGNSVILWISQDTTKRNYLLYGAEKTLLGNWSSPALISLSSDDVNVDFRFVFLDTGLLRVVWSSILDEKIYTSDTTFNTWTWSAPLLISN